MRRPGAYDDCVIAGVGHTAFSVESGRMERELAAEALAAAVEDAGLGLTDVDGLVTYDLDSNDPMMLAQELGLRDLHWFSCTPYGGGLACGAVQDAALAVAAGLARVVVVYRAANMRSGRRFGQGGVSNPQQLGYFEWPHAVGLLTPGQMGALSLHRWLYERGLGNEDLAPVVKASRDYARRNPMSRFYGTEFCEEEHQRSPWVAEPVLRMLDCCLENDGGVALVVTTRERARDGRGAVAIAGAARGISQGGAILQNYYRPVITGFPDLEVVLRQLFAQTGLSAGHLDVAIVYDAFSPFVPIALETLGRCAPSEVIDYVRAGGIAVDGDLPVNPNGGQLGEAYLHGFNGLAEAVRQVRGTAINQVKDVEHVLVTGGPALPTSGLILAAR